MNHPTDCSDNSQPLNVPRPKMARLRGGIAVLVVALAGLVPFVATAAPARANTWTVTLTASSTTVWPTQYVTLTATSNIDVAQSGGHLRIYDDYSGVDVRDCYSGTTCSVSVTQPQFSEPGYDAAVVDGSGNILASNNSPVWVEWRSVRVSLAANPTTVAVGASSTLTATTNADIGPSPFYTEIFDATTAARIQYCGYGTSCSVSVSQSVATTHTFRAFVSPKTTSYPPPGAQATSGPSFITWANTGWSVTISTSSYTYNTILTATANADIGPTPYYIEIFDERGSLLKSCPRGASCQTSYYVPAGGTHIVAFVSPNTATLPPPGAQASSNVLTFGSYKP